MLIFFVEKILDLFLLLHIKTFFFRLQVILTLAEAESVITWDFDVIEGDCHFQVLRHKRPREANTVTTTCLGGDSSLTSKPSIRPGIDAQVVERPILCRQGDSMQVSKLYFIRNDIYI